MIIKYIVQVNIDADEANDTLYNHLSIALKKNNFEKVLSFDLVEKSDTLLFLDDNGISNLMSFILDLRKHKSISGTEIKVCKVLNDYKMEKGHNNEIYALGYIQMSSQLDSEILTELQHLRFVDADTSVVFYGLTFDNFVNDVMVLLKSNTIEKLLLEANDTIRKIKGVKDTEFYLLKNLINLSYRPLTEVEAAI